MYVLVGGKKRRGGAPPGRAREKGRTCMASVSPGVQRLWTEVGGKKITKVINRSYSQRHGDRSNLEESKKSG